MTATEPNDADDSSRPTVRRRVAVVGAGGIGHPAIGALADAAVDFTIIDDDLVELSNLHRLPFAGDGDLGHAKGDAAATLLAGRRASVREVVRARVVPSNALELLAGHDVVIEGADNYPTKFLVADACGLLGIPVVHGAAIGWLGTVFSCVPGRSACYRCLFESPPAGEGANCASAGIYGPVATLVGALMAADASRLLRGDASLAGSIASIDGWRGTFRSLHLPPRPECPLCGTGRIRALTEDLYITPDVVA